MGFATGTGQHCWLIIICYGSDSLSHHNNIDNSTSQRSISRLTSLRTTRTSQPVNIYNKLYKQHEPNPSNSCLISHKHIIRQRTTPFPQDHAHRPPPPHPGQHATRVSHLSRGASNLHLSPFPIPGEDTQDVSLPPHIPPVSQPRVASAAKQTHSQLPGPKVDADFLMLKWCTVP